MQLGDVVAITFRDHCQGSDEPVTFIAYGRVSAKNKEFVTVDAWAYAHEYAARDQNIERFCILRSAIKKVEVLKRRENT